MPSLRKTHRPRNQWLARRKRNNIEYILGCYPTYTLALLREQEFDIDWPSERGKQGFIYRPWNKGIRYTKAELNDGTAYARSKMLSTSFAQNITK